MKQSDFIMSKYLPRGLILKDPRSMRRSEMIKFFDHIGNRQSSHGINDAFRFKTVLSSRKKGDLTRAVYIDLEPTATSTVFIPGPDIYDTQGPAQATMVNTGMETALEIESQPAFNMEQMTSVFAVNKDMPPTTQDTTEPAPALTEVTRSLRPRKKKAGKQTVVPSTQDTGSELAPALTEDTRSLRPRPRPIQKKKASQQTCIESQSGSVVPDIALSEHPTLVLDPDYQWEPQINLDPSLELSFTAPALDSSSSYDITSEPAFESSLTSQPAFAAPAPASSSLNDLTSEPAFAVPALASPISQSMSFMPELAKTPRRKSKADLLAIEEAKNYMATGKRRR